MTLELVLKKKWFDMIASGEKKEEYRELTSYWAARLVDELDSNPQVDEGFMRHGHYYGMGTPQPFEIVRFRHGYSKNAPEMSFKISDITVWAGKFEWGAEPGKKYFVIKLGDRIEEALREQPITV